MNSAQALHSFWASFGWETYDENSVPDNAGFPRLTYDVIESTIDDKVALNGNLFNKSTSWATLQEKLEQIDAVIGRGGKIVNYDGGALWITKGAPFARRYSENDTIKQIIINIQVEYIKL